MKLTEEKPTQVRFQAITWGRLFLFSQIFTYLTCCSWIVSVWLATQNHSTLVTDTTVVPFLPVNPEYSSTRNQASFCRRVIYDQRGIILTCRVLKCFFRADKNWRGLALTNLPPWSSISWQMPKDDSGVILVKVPKVMSLSFSLFERPYFIFVYCAWKAHIVLNFFPCHMHKTWWLNGESTVQEFWIAKKCNPHAQGQFRILCFNHAQCALSTLCKKHPVDLGCKLQHSVNHNKPTSQPVLVFLRINRDSWSR